MRLWEFWDVKLNISSDYIPIGSEVARSRANRETGLPLQHPPPNAESQANSNLLHATVLAPLPVYHGNEVVLLAPEVSVDH